MKNSLAIYLQDIGQFPLLTAAQELELGRRIKDENDEDARQTMINCNLRLVVNVAKKYNNGNHSVSLEDLIAEGNNGLIAAVEKYDYTLGYRFSTCAVPWIKQAITKSIIDHSRAIRIPAHIIQRFNKYATVCEELVKELDREPTLDEIAKKMEIEVEDVQDILRWKQNTASLETPLGDEDGNTLEDVCADEYDESPKEYTEKGMRHEFVQKLLADLPDRTKTIFKLRFGLGTDEDPAEYRVEHTLEEIGDLLNPKITRERVRQIVTQQISKWKTQFGDKLSF